MSHLKELNDIGWIFLTVISNFQKTIQKCNHHTLISDFAYCCVQTQGAMFLFLDFKWDKNNVAIFLLRFS